MKASRDCINFHGNKLSQSKSRRLLPGSLCDTVIEKAHATSGHKSVACSRVSRTVSQQMSLL